MIAERTVSVILVEDSTLIRERLRRLLGECGCIRIVGEAGEVQEALALWDQVRPDAMILDLNIPGGSGIDVLRRVKSERPSCVVVVLTNHTAEEYADACVRLGADYFFQKATEFERVVDVLAGLQRL